MSRHCTHKARAIRGRVRIPVSALLLGCVCAIQAGCARPYYRHEHLSLSVAPPADRLVVRSHSGNVTVRADAEADEIRAEITKTGRGTSPDDAQDALEAIQVSLAPKEGEPSTLLASAEHPDSNNWRAYKVEWRLIAPPHVAIDIHTKFGDVEARGFSGEVALASTFGDVHVEAAGTIEVQSKFGDVEVYVRQQDPDEVRAFTTFGDLSVRLPADRTGRLMANTAFGTVDMGLEGMSLRLVRQRGRQFEGDLGGLAEPKMDLGSRFGDVTVRCYPVPESQASEP